MAKKPESTKSKKPSTTKPVVSKSASSKEERSTDKTKRPEKKIVAEGPATAQPSSTKKDDSAGTSADRSTKELLKDKPVMKKKKKATTPAKPSAQPAAKVALSSAKKAANVDRTSPTVSRGGTVTPKEEMPSEAVSSFPKDEKTSIPAKPTASAKKRPQSTAEKPGLQAKAEIPLPSKGQEIDKSRPAKYAPAVEPVTPEPEAPPAAKSTTDLPPPATAAPSQPQSVHVEEPLPAVESEHHEEPAPAAYHPSLFIVQITPEMAPVAKVGGLADVVFGLTRELAIRGNHVEIILPKYNTMRYDHIYDLQVDFHDLWVPWYDGEIHCTVYFGHVYERKCFFIEPHSNDNFFNRNNIYGFSDDVLRYAFFSRAAMEFLWKTDKHPDIIHCHDWQTALAPVYLYEFYQRMGMTHPRACLTIHNFQHQGVTGGELLRATGLHQPERFFDYHRMRDNNHPNALNLLKAGIVYSNFVTTVSPHYAFETKDQGQGFGLEPTLHTHHIKYGGVVNGIDYDVWNPEVDGHIPTRYGVDSIEGKYNNKRALRHRLMLADNEKPVVAFIGRLDPQKGLDLVRHAIFYALERGAQFVLLGSSPYQGINADFWGLKGMLNDSQDCHLEIGFDEELSHLIYAGADMMLVPSRFEPCGLTQLIALRYGTIPVVRSVGGLADTVFDKDHSKRPLHERNGYVFENYDHTGLESALGRAIACYYNHPDHFRELMKNAMRYDYSWNNPGRDYLNIYDYIREK